ncbi:hypothetical protein LP065_10310 [Latilactobacillus sakei]|uniref:hypothetical protein n=1 Tax=Latilactobacillus sakei TaxID=1599 RepID=UPI000A17A712|nr:hypothetical protein [Latilactobacillus sakei]ARJ72896.1 hypothetical protein LP065_10310 [Latilactobacillus sakei]
MPEKVKLPKFMCEWLSDIALMEDYPLEAILESEKLRYGNREVLMWSTGQHSQSMEANRRPALRV